MKYHKLLVFVTLIMIVLGGVGCDTPTVKEHELCSVSSFFDHHDLKGNAGCLIKIDGKAVLVNEGWEFSPPGGGFKVFNDEKEAAWQTACRETHEGAAGFHQKTDLFFECQQYISCDLVL